MNDDDTIVSEINGAKHDCIASIMVALSQNKTLREYTLAAISECLEYSKDLIIKNE